MNKWALGSRIEAVMVSGTCYTAEAPFGDDDNDDGDDCDDDVDADEDDDYDYDEDDDLSLIHI